MRLPCYNSIVLSLVSQSEPYHFGGVLSIVRQWMALGPSVDGLRASHTAC